MIKHLDFLIWVLLYPLCEGVHGLLWIKVGGKKISDYTDDIIFAYCVIQLSIWIGVSILLYNN